MTIAWYDPTNRHVSTDKNDPLFTPLGQLWPLDVQRTWKGLTDEQKQIAAWTDGTFGAGAFWAEAKLKDKNT